MLLICDYTASPAVVVAWYDDAATAPAPAAGLTAVPWTQAVGALGRVGPPPTWLGSDTRPYAAPPAPSPASQLALYAAGKQSALAVGGYTITLSGQALTFETDDVSRSDIMGTFLLLAQPNPPTTIGWHFASGFVPVSAADFAKAATAIANFRLATFVALQAVLAAITAGTITTTAQIDAASWPSNVAASS